MRSPAKVEQEIRGYIERALEQGYYPDVGVYEDGEGGRCLLGLIAGGMGIEYRSIYRPNSKAEFPYRRIADRLGIRLGDVWDLEEGWDDGWCQGEASPWLTLGVHLGRDYCWVEDPAAKRLAEAVQADIQALTVVDEVAAIPIIEAKAA